MPKSSAVEDIVLSPAEMVLELIGDILDEPKMDAHDKLGMLRELCLERITFDSPQQAVRIISMLADIVSSDPAPEVRVAALRAMERMIGLEQKAEAELGKPMVDWRKVNLMLRQAKKQTELDTLPVASRYAAPAPESPSPQISAAFAVSGNSAAPEAHAVSRDDFVQDNAGVTASESAMLAVQEKAVAAVKQANVPVVPPSATQMSAGPEPEAPAPSRGVKKLEPVEEKSEPPIMKFLRSVADADDEEHIRDLANRIIEKIENMTNHKALTPAPVLTEG